MPDVETFVMLSSGPQFRTPLFFIRSPCHMDYTLLAYFTKTVPTIDYGEAF